MSGPIDAKPLFDAQAEDAILRLPLAELVAHTDLQIARADLFCRAGRSGLYRRRWRAAGIKPERLAGREGLRQVPFLTADDLLAVVATGSRIHAALLTQPRTWVTSHGKGVGTKKWLPLTLNDVAHWFGRVSRVNRLLDAGAQPVPALALILNEPMPRVSNAVPYLWERADYLAGNRRFEFIIAAMEMLWRNHWDRFALKKRPHWIMASASDARRLAREMDGDARSLLRDPRCGVFWGEPLDGPLGVRTELAEIYGLSESFSLYFSAECREMYVECRAHAGLHVWMDGAIHEIIPGGQAACGVERAEAVFVDQATPGTEGEYVVTTLDEALPLVRYRTGDRIRVVDTAPCACGITHPRVLFLGRQSA